MCFSFFFLKTKNELMVNITKHKLVPKHEPLSQEDKQKLLEK